MEKMKLIALVALSAVTMVMASGLVGAQSEDISCTVTVRQVALSVSPTSYAFGLMDSGDNENTYTGTAHYFTLQNTGNCKENFTTKGASTANWTLASSQGSEEYVMKSTDASATETEAEATFDITLTTSAASFTGAMDISASTSKYFDLRISVPTSTASTAEQTATVTIGAIAAMTD